MTHGEDLKNEMRAGLPQKVPWASKHTQLRLYEGIGVDAGPSFLRPIYARASLESITVGEGSTSRMCLRLTPAGDADKYFRQPSLARDNTQSRRHRMAFIIRGPHTNLLHVKAPRMGGNDVPEGSGLHSGIDKIVSRHVFVNCEFGGLASRSLQEQRIQMRRACRI
jgi:hypothetical protein